MNLPLASGALAVLHPPSLSPQYPMSHLTRLPPQPTAVTSAVTNPTLQPGGTDSRAGDRRDRQTRCGCLPPRPPASVPDSLESPGGCLARTRAWTLKDRAPLTFRAGMLLAGGHCPVCCRVVRGIPACQATPSVGTVVAIKGVCSVPVCVGERACRPHVRITAKAEAGAPTPAPSACGHLGSAVPIVGVGTKPYAQSPTSPPSPG